LKQFIFQREREGEQEGGTNRSKKNLGKSLERPIHAIIKCKGVRGVGLNLKTNTFNHQVSTMTTALLSILFNEEQFFFMG
jgi:hypothetical protein